LNFLKIPKNGVQPAIPNSNSNGFTIIYDYIHDLYNNLCDTMKNVPIDFSELYIIPVLFEPTIVTPKTIPLIHSNI
jgi:hypothetical protein